jgi:hypothetical protein
MQATPSTGVVAQYPTAVEHDLAAMVLPAEDLPVDGLTLRGGRLLGAEQEAQLAADALEMDAEDVLAELEDIGWKARFPARTTRPPTPSPVPATSPSTRTRTAPPPGLTCSRKRWTRRRTISTRRRLAISPN